MSTTIIAGRNVHAILPRGLMILDQRGYRRSSRNGDVMIMPGRVITEYERPIERVVFWEQRDYNIAFVLYEALWMLAGRNDVAPLKRYVRDFDRYSDDGATLHAAYGHRWRKQFGVDQLAVIAERLSTKPDDRRSVLQIWDSRLDLQVTDDARDIPCNDTVTFQLDQDGRLDMTVFCRSNDLLWGAYYANAFHFSLLLEYMAFWIGVPVGIYCQISVNFHGYVKTIEPMKIFDFGQANPYDTVKTAPWSESLAAKVRVTQHRRIQWLDQEIHNLLACADVGNFRDSVKLEVMTSSPFYSAAIRVLEAHHLYRTGDEFERFQDAIIALSDVTAPFLFDTNDMIRSMRQWLGRRYENFMKKSIGA